MSGGGSGGGGGNLISSWKVCTICHFYIELGGSELLLLL